MTMMTNADPDYRHLYEEAGLRLIDGAPTGKICFETIGKIRKELSENNYDVVEVDLISHHPVAGSGEFMCQGFFCHDWIRSFAFFCVNND